MHLSDTNLYVYISTQSGRLTNSANVSYSMDVIHLAMEWCKGWAYLDLPTPALRRLNYLIYIPVGSSIWRMRTLTRVLSNGVNAYLAAANTRASGNL